MDEIRIGIVGSGGMARRRALAFAALDGCPVPAVAARNPETGSDHRLGSGWTFCSSQELNSVKRKVRVSNFRMKKA